MKPYYEHGGITIYHGDCLDVLAALDVEAAAIVMDPPYASGARTEAEKRSSGSMLRGQRWNAKPIDNDQMTTAGFIWLMRHVLQSVPLVQGGSVLSFIDWRQWPNLLGAVESVNLRVQTMIVWDKESFGLGNGFRVQHELIMHACKGTPRIEDKGTPNVIRCPREDNSEHPSPKPRDLMHRLMRVVTAPGDLVIDPFMGCGPTLEAARDLGRMAVGIELNERYCEIAAKRLEQEVLPLEQPA
jgi:site-specific DNA-methyltransferase (adenine-specific)